MTELRAAVAPRVVTKVMSTEMSIAMVILPLLHVLGWGNRAKRQQKCLTITGSEKKRSSYIFE